MRVTGSHILALLSAIALHSLACASHVALRAPDRGAAFAERKAAYDRLLPIEREGARATGDSAPQVAAMAEVNEWVTLSDGQRIHSPEDLLPVVSAGSDTATAASRSGAAKRKMRWWGAVAGGAFAVGSGLLVVGAVQGDDVPGGAEGFDVMMSTGVIGLVTTIVATLPVIYYGQRASDARQSAFASYESSLRDHLLLCVRGGELDDCRNTIRAQAGGATRHSSTNASLQR